VSALELLAEALARSRAATTAERLPASARRVGEAFMRAADDVPGMFTQGRSFASDAQGLADQFGVGVSRMRPLNPAENPDDVGALWGYAMPADERRPLPHSPRLMGATHTKLNLLNPRVSTPSVVDALVNGLLEGDQTHHVWDTTNLDITSGQGGRLYPAAFGALSNYGQDHKNISLALSGANQLRRSYNQAAALERDPSLASKILVNPTQLNSKYFDYNIPLSTGAFHRMSPEEQVGVLQLAASQGALSSMRNSMLRNADRVLNPHGEEALKTAQRQRSMDRMDYAAPAFFSDPGNVSAEPLARGYQQSPAALSFPLGERSLRKLGIVQDALRGASFEDLAGRFPGLEYADGGSVW